MAFKTSGIDFAKLLWDQHKIKYGPLDSYCHYPRRFKTRGIRTCSVTNDSKVVPLEFIIDIKDDVWINIVTGGVTGYESASLNDLSRDSRDWYACAGCKYRYDTLLVKSADLIALIREVTVYVKEISNESKTTG